RGTGQRRMTTRVVILRSAQIDLQDLKDHLVKKFGKAAWQKSYKGIKAAVIRLETYPKAGRIPSELAALNLAQYRQVLSGMSRIIYELRGDTAFVHIICDTRMDMRTLLMRRLLQVQ